MFTDSNVTPYFKVKVQWVTGTDSHFLLDISKLINKQATSNGARRKEDGEFLAKISIPHPHEKVLGAATARCGRYWLHVRSRLIKSEIAKDHM